MNRNQPLIHEDFLLSNEQARRLYHDYAAKMPILDYHSHLPPDQIASDHRFENLAQIWLYGDHYKWRAMRANGVPERFCTGDASDWEKFLKWAETVPKTIRNPLYHWTHLELNRPFGIKDRLLSPETAEGIWKECNEKLAQPEFSCRGILKQMNVVALCTTDDPTDSLEHHKAIAADASFSIVVLPTFRPDKAMNLDSPEDFNRWVDRLAKVSGMEIKDYDTFIEALRSRHDYFHEMGCRLSDHGLENFPDATFSATEIANIFREASKNRPIPLPERHKFRMAVLLECARMNHEKGWTQQFHVGALRNNNTKMFRELGPDTGFDSMADGPLAKPMARFFDQLARNDQLTKTIVYNLNPSKSDVMATMIGNFQDGSEPGKMQYGAAWWFLDQRDGMLRQMEVLSNYGLLSRFVGMLTDSRSFLSFTRHEYFRRILCDMLGREMADGLIPNDMEAVGELVCDICYNNAARYFGFDVPQDVRP
ncbi:glucuronate isomerase [Thermostilla marina]